MQAGVEHTELQEKWEPLIETVKKRLTDDQPSGLQRTNQWQRYIPRVGGLRHQLVHDAHHIEIVGLFVASRTYNVLHARFFWPVMLASVKGCMKTCATGQ